LGDLAYAGLSLIRGEKFIPPAPERHRDRPADQCTRKFRRTPEARL